MRKLLAAMFGSVMFSLLSTASAHAAGSLSFDPGTGNIGKGQKFVVKVMLDTGGNAVNATQINISYPKDSVEKPTITPSPVFSIQAQNYVDNGQIKIARASATAVNGRVEIASLSFTATKDGPIELKFTEGTNVVRMSDQANIAESLGTAKFSIGSTGSANQNSGTTNENKTPEATSEGVPVTIEVKDSLGLPVKGAQVTLGGITLTTDGNGKVTFNDAGPSHSEFTVTKNGKTVAKNIDGPNPQITLVAGQSSALPFLLVVGICLLISLSAAGLFLIRNRRQNLPSQPAI